MKQYRKKSTLTQRGAYLKNRIARNRGRAQFVGLIYLLATIALAGVLILPAFLQQFDFLGVYHFWKEFTLSTFKSLNTVGNILNFARLVLYILLLLGLVINVLRAIGKLGWLFKKRASQTYGFNRNAYAMEDMGRIFSGSYAIILSTLLLVSVMYGMKVLDWWKLCKAMNYLPLYLMGGALGGGILIHLFAGFVGGKIAYFDVEDGEILEQKRVVGRFAPVFRNILQIGVVFAVIFFFLNSSRIHTVIGPLLEKNSLKNYVLDNLLGYISIVLQVLTLIFIFPMIKHATAITEYDIDGGQASGMKTFRVFTFLAFLTAAATAVFRYLPAFGEITFSQNAEGYTVFIIKQYIDYASIIVAGICFVMFIIELIMHNRPRVPSEQKDSDDVDIDIASQPDPAEDAIANPVLPSQSHQIHIHPQPHYYTPAPAPTIVTVDAKIVEEEDDEDEEETVEENVVLEVNCPVCGKALRVNSSSPYHRCPSCSRVFQLRKIKKYR